MPTGLTAEQEAQFALELKLAESEIMAKAAEYVLGSEEMIDRLVESERSTARSWLRRIKERIKLIENAFKGDKSANAALKELRKAEKLFSDALAASGEKYLRRAYVKRDEEKEAQGAGLDNSESVQYSKTGYSQYRTLALQWANNAKTEQGDIKVFFDPSTNTYNKLIADESADVGYRVLFKVKDTVANAERINHYIRRLAMIVTEKNKALVKSFVKILVDLEVSQEATGMICSMITKKSQMDDLVIWIESNQTATEAEILDKAEELTA